MCKWEPVIDRQRLLKLLNAEERLVEVEISTPERRMRSGVLRLKGQELVRQVHNFGVAIQGQLDAGQVEVVRWPPQSQFQRFAKRRGCSLIRSGLEEGAAQELIQRSRLRVLRRREPSIRQRNAKIVVTQLL